MRNLATGKVNLFKGPLNYQDGKPFVKAGQTASNKQIWYMEQLLGWRGKAFPNNFNFHFLNGSFSDARRSPRVYFLDVLPVRLVVNPCAAWCIEKISHS
jgi:hypothetical protein